MKPILILILFLSFTLTVYGQRIDYPDSGFTNKAEAKNLYKDTLKEGKWLEYRVRKYTNTRVDTIGYELIVYKKGQATGIARFYSKEDTSYSLNTETPYANGIVNGVEKTYYSPGHVTIDMATTELIISKGTISSISTFVNGKREGVSKSYYERGTLQCEVLYKNDKEDGVERHYFEDGKIQGERTYDNGSEIGTEKWFYESGALHIESPYVNGIINGLSKEYYESGQLMREDPWFNGKLNGTTKVYYENGILQEEIPYTEFLKISGIHKWYYESGKIKEECPMTNGYANGINKKYYENGNIMSEIPDTAVFVNGSITQNYINGDVKNYYENGRIKSRTIFANGELGRTKHYDLNGMEIIRKPSTDTIEKIRKILIGKWVEVFNYSNTWTFSNDTINIKDTVRNTNVCWKYTIEVESPADTSTHNKYWFGLSYYICGDNANYYLSEMSTDGKSLEQHDMFYRLTKAFERKE